MKRESFVTLATNDEQCIGCLVLSASLRQTNTSKELSVMVTEGVSPSLLKLLKNEFDNVCEVDSISPASTSSPDVRLFTKINCWSLVQFSKAVFLESDTMALHNIDELFEREELSAVPDPHWPDYFNTGVFVYRPSLETYNALLKMVKEASPNEDEQSLLNTYFSNWLTKGISHRLSYVYNCICEITEESGFDFYTCAPAWVQFGGAIRIARFAGPIKPWHRVSAARNCSQYACQALLTTQPGRRMISRTDGMLAYWWSLFLILVRPKLSPDMPGIAGQLARLNMGNTQLCPRHEWMETERMYAWERGEIDYTGTDRFANILAKLCETMVKTGGETNVPVGFDALMTQEQQRESARKQHSS